MSSPDEKLRCRACGHIQRIPSIPAKTVDHDPQSTADTYPLATELPARDSAQAPSTLSAMHDVRAKQARPSKVTGWRRVVRTGISKSSLLEMESLGLITLSAADLLITYALLRRGPAFYESNPVAQWFFTRWNIAGMALFKFSAIGLVVIIGEIVERHRPAWGRSLLLVSCLATAVVIFHGLRLLVGHEDNGAPLP